MDRDGRPRPSSPWRGRGRYEAGPFTTARRSDGRRHGGGVPVLLREPRDCLTPNTASRSRYSSPGTKTCVTSVAQAVGGHHEADAPRASASGRWPRAGAPPTWAVVWDRAGHRRDAPERVPALVIAEQARGPPCGCRCTGRRMDRVGPQTSIRGARDGLPSVPTTPSTQHGFPNRPVRHVAADRDLQASSTKNGPNTVASVAFPWASLLTAMSASRRPAHRTTG